MRTPLLLLSCVVAWAGVAGCAPEREERPPFTGTWVLKGGTGSAPAPTTSSGGEAEAEVPDLPGGGGPTTSDADCSDLPAGGTCAGNTLRACVGDKVVELPCDVGGGFCVVNKVAEQATCIYPDGGNPCADMTEPSVCNGDVVMWCEDGALKAADCVSVGKICAWDDSQGFNACVDP